MLLLATVSHCRVLLHRGSAKRDSYSKMAYIQRVHCIPSPFQRQIAGVPPTILTRARMPFHLYPAGPSASGLAKLGLYGPPYAPVIPIDLITHTIYGSDDLFAEEIDEEDKQDMVSEKKTTGTLNAFQYRLMKSNGECRVKQWMQESTSEIVSKTTQELEARIQSWKWYDGQNVYFDDPHMLVARRVALDWGARIICTLATELEILQKGHDSYEKAFETELLPWQCMNVDLTGL